MTQFPFLSVCVRASLSTSPACCSARHIYLLGRVISGWPRPWEAIAAQISPHMCVRSTLAACSSEQNKKSQVCVSCRASARGPHTHAKCRQVMVSVSYKLLMQKSYSKTPGSVFGQGSGYERSKMLLTRTLWRRCTYITFHVDTLEMHSGSRF